MKKLTSLAFLLLSALCFSQSIEEISSKKHQHIADSLYKIGDYYKAQNEYHKSNYYDRSNLHSKNMKDSCIYYISVITQKKDKERSEKIKAEQQALIIETKNDILLTDSLNRAKNMGQEDIEITKLDAEMHNLSSHHQLTQFTDMPLNYVSSKIQTYMHKYFDYYVSSSDLIDGRYVMVFEPQKTHGGTKKMKVVFDVITKGNFFYIKSCKMSGDSDVIVNFYCKYWQTTATVSSDMKSVDTRLLNDIVQLTKSNTQYSISIKKSPK